MTGGRGHILVVDDDRTMVRTLCDLLRFSGWETTSAYSGEEAASLVERGETYTAVLMDVRMTGITGVDALRAMRAHRPTLPVVLMTAYASGALLQQAADWGATRVLHKPVPIPQLLELLGAFGATAPTLLVVDDDAGFLESLTPILTQRGYAVLTARTLEAALAHLRHSTPAVVLLDLKLDSREPLEVLQQVRDASPATPIILCSGHEMLLAECSARGNGQIVGQLCKPFAPDQLARALSAAHV